MRSSLVIVTCAAAGLAGCYGPGEGTLSDTSPGGAGSDGGSRGAGTGATASGLPCDVAQLLSTHCTSCHTDPPIRGPMSLMSYEDLAAPAPSDTAKTVAQVALARMKDTLKPMPPAPSSPVSAGEIAAFQAWLTAGVPRGVCATSDGGTNPYDTPLTCTSNTTWTGGDRGSSQMRPGGPCISCHAGRGEDAPPYSIAGTVYPSAHEPDDCNGTGGANVVVVDAKGQTLTLTTNPAGNFYSSATLTPPYRASVVANGKTREMVASQTRGDCNSCHTGSGTSAAPGRIMVP